MAGPPISTEFFCSNPGLRGPLPGGRCLLAALSGVFVFQPAGLRRHIVSGNSAHAVAERRSRNRRPWGEAAGQSRPPLGPQAFRLRSYRAPGVPSGLDNPALRWQRCPSGDMGTRRLTALVGLGVPAVIPAPQPRARRPGSAILQEMRIRPLCLGAPSSPGCRAWGDRCAPPGENSPVTTGRQLARRSCRRPTGLAPVATRPDHLLLNHRSSHVAAKRRQTGVRPVHSGLSAGAPKPGKPRATRRNFYVHVPVFEHECYRRSRIFAMGLAFQAGGLPVPPWARR